MAILNLGRLETDFANQWVVLNRELEVVDFGSDLAPLLTRRDAGRYYTFYFVQA